MNTTTDSLQVKIEEAKRKLPLEAINAISAVDWKSVILGMRETKGYSFEQLGDLELATELLLCGLLSTQSYPHEIESRMKIGSAAANELVQEMNEKVFSKIKGELIKNTERKRIFVKSQKDDEALSRTKVDVIEPEIGSGISKEETEEDREGLLEKIEKPELITIPVKEEHPILAQKLSGGFQVPTVKTEYTLDNLTKPDRPHNDSGTGGGMPDAKVNPPAIDPYREIPE